MINPEKYLVGQVVRPASYPAVLVSSFFEGAQELLGEEKFLQVIDCQFSGDVEIHSGVPKGLAAFSTKEPGRFLQVLETLYGKSGGHGLALRIGRASFKYALKRMDSAALFHHPEFHLLPAGRRMEKGLEYLAQFVSPGDQNASTVTSTDSHWLWHSASCPDGAQRQGFDPGCFALAGLLQEFMLWAGNGRYYRVVETKCRAAGSPFCEFHIDKKPLD